MARKIFLRENQYNRLFTLKENQEDEIRTVNDDGTVEVDNFDLIARLISQDPAGDKVYFCQIVRRQKDNPEFSYAKNSADYLTYYIIKSPQELLSLKDEIKIICKKFKARAMFYMNPRSARQVNTYVNNVLLPKLEGITGGTRTPSAISARNKNPRYDRYRDSWGHEEEIAYGESKDDDLKWPGRDICHIDIDSDDPEKIKIVHDMLKKAGIKPLGEYRSMNNGVHIICPDKNAVRNLDFSIADKGVYMGRWASVSVEIDKSVLLYALATPHGYDIQRKIQNAKYQTFLRTGNKHQENFK
jgi:hypothetical protein